jgi:hypothetical protein
MPNAFKERNLVGRFFYRFPSGESGADVYDRVPCSLALSLSRSRSATARQLHRVRCEFGCCPGAQESVLMISLAITRGAWCRCRASLRLCFATLSTGTSAKTL